MNVRIANRRYEDVLADNNLPQATEVCNFGMYITQALLPDQA